MHTLRYVLCRASPGCPETSEPGLIVQTRKEVVVEAPKKTRTELRERAVWLYRESDPKAAIRRLAEQLNVHPDALRNWIRQDEANAGERHDRPTTDVAEENRRLKRENAELKRVNEVLRAASAYFAGEIDPPEVVMSFIDDHDFSVGLVLRVLGIPASTYYDWRPRHIALTVPPRGRRVARADRDNTVLARARRRLRVPAGVAGTASARRAMFPQTRGTDHAREHPARRSPALEDRFHRQKPAQTAVPDLVGRDFTATAPNRLWAADLARLLTGEGVLWLASVRDAFSNRIVGWATAGTDPNRIPVAAHPG